MGQVNSHRENRASEKDFEASAPTQGAQRPAENGGIPGLFSADRLAERLSVQAMLADGEELSSNPLRRVFNDLRTTQISVDVAWRILDLFAAVSTSCNRFPAIVVVEIAAVIFGEGVQAREIVKLDATLPGK